MKKSILEASLYKMMNIIMRLYGITEKKDDCLKSSTGLQSVYIDMSRFNMRPFIEAGLHHKMLPILFKLFSGITKAKKDYKKAMETPASRAGNASPEFWEEIRHKAQSLGIGVIGFAPVDENLIFQTDYVGKIRGLYENAIVLGMEMDFSAIDLAPAPQAGLEAMRVYADLGVATNKLSDFVRSRGYKAIACHPLGGPILFPAMAEKANMGQMGKLGFLITKEFGPRLRLSMIATNASPIPESSVKDFGVLDFCEKCGICIRKCPAGAVYETPVQKERGLYTCISSEKCFSEFYDKDGCSVCIKVCPFHKKEYDLVMGSYTK
jgi:epoxyqueuosine reductase